MLERVFSLALVALVAALYGVSGRTDTYYLALIVPAALGFALSDALYTAFLPFFTRPEGPNRALLAGALRLGVPVAAGLTAVYLAVLAAARPHGLVVWVGFLGLILAQPVAGVYAAFVTAERRYALATLRVPLITAAALAVAAVLLATWHSIVALAVALSLGHVASLAFVAWRERRARAPEGEPSERRRPPLRVLSPALSVFLATLTAGQLVVIAERFLASSISAGAVTLLVNARGFVLAAAMISQALASGVFPAATERFKAFDRAALAHLALVAVRVAALTALVCAAFVAVARHEVIEVVLERGKFGRSDAVETARLTAIMAPSLLGISIGAVAGRALFAVGRQRLVAVVSAGGIAVYLAFALGLRDIWRVEGLAAAFTFSAIATGGVLAGALARELELSWVATLREWLLAPTALAAAFGAAAWGAWLAVGRGTEGVASALLAIAVVGLAGLAALAAAITATRAREYELLRGLVERAARPRLAPFAG